MESLKRRQNISPGITAAGLVLLLAATGFYFLFFHARNPFSGLAPAGSGKNITLYFATRDGFAQQLFPAPATPSWQEQMRIVIERMGIRPANASEPTLWPLPLRVHNLFRLGDGTLVLDLEIGVAYNPDSSAFSEFQALRSLIHTLKLNFPTIQRVKFLVNGAEQDALGHMDISRPLGEEDFQL